MSGVAATKIASAQNPLVALLLNCVSLTKLPAMQAMQKYYQVLESKCFQKFLYQNRSVFTSVL